MTAYAQLRATLSPRTVCQAMWYFERFNFMAGLTNSSLDRVLRSRALEVARGRSLDLRGAGDDVFIVGRGRVHVADVSRTGRLMTRTVLREGDVLGACDVWEAGSLGQAAEAWDDCSLHVLSCASFVQFVNTAPALRVRITRAVNGRELALERRVDDLVLSAAEARLARMFLSLARQHGRVGDDGLSIPIALTYTELGQLIGLSDTAVRRMLGTWCLYGFLEARDGMLRLCDLDALQRVARGAQAYAPPPDSARASSRRAAREDRVRPPRWLSLRNATSKL